MARGTIPASWDLNRVPETSDDVVIPNLAGSQVITFSSGDSTVQSIDSLERIEISAGTLRVAAGLSASDGVDLTGGTLIDATVGVGTTVRGSATGGVLSNVVIDGALDVTVASAQLTVANDLTINGTADFATGSTVIVQAGFGSRTDIEIHGVLTANGATFLDSGGGTSQIRANDGGQLVAADSLFVTTYVTLSENAVFNSGDLANNAFDTDFYLAAQHVPLLSAARGGARQPAVPRYLHHQHHAGWRNPH